jgi:hypothetical protein
MIILHVGTGLVYHLPCDRRATLGAPSAYLGSFFPPSRAVVEGGSGRQTNLHICRMSIVPYIGQLRSNNPEDRYDVKRDHFCPAGVDSP